MAKSLRSKRRRKMRAEKRIVNAKKELVKLKEVAAKLHGMTKDSIESAIPDVQVSHSVEHMQVDDTAANGGKSKKLVINNQWMNQRKIKSIKKKIKRHNTKKSRRGSGAAGLSSRKAKRKSR